MRRVELLERIAKNTVLFLRLNRKMAELDTLNNMDEVMVGFMRNWIYKLELRLQKLTKELNEMPSHEAELLKCKNNSMRCVNMQCCGDWDKNGFCNAGFNI
jgi:hypothetical protein